MPVPKQTLEKLIQTATKVRKHAYAPYSHYLVGAALLGKSGNIYTGVNVENAAYPTSICAERTAVFKAVSEGERSFKAIAIVTENAGSPCGSCRQVLAEFGLDLVVIQADLTGEVKKVTSLKELLPGAFTPTDLPHDRK
jgi:cytidine deaminase